MEKDTDLICKETLNARVGPEAWRRGRTRVIQVGSEGKCGEKFICRCLLDAYEIYHATTIEVFKHVAKEERYKLLHNGIYFIFVKYVYKLARCFSILSNEDFFFLLYLFL